MVSDAIFGTVEGSEEQLEQLFTSGYDDIILTESDTSLNDTAHLKKEPASADIAKKTQSSRSTDGLKEEITSDPSLARGSEESEPCRGMKKKDISSVSFMVLYKGERWKKGELRKWMNEKKKKKMVEFMEMRERDKKKKAHSFLPPSSVPKVRELVGIREAVWKSMSLLKDIHNYYYLDQLFCLL